MKKVYVLVLIAIGALMFVSSSGAMMGGPMMTNSGGFGMMNGMAGTPVVGDDGTAYLVTYNPTANPGAIPTNNSFESKLLAIKPTGEIVSLSLKGLISRPVVAGNVLVATASLPDFGNYMMTGNYGTNPSNGQSVIYLISLPLTASSVPQAVSMDGSYASIPVIGNNRAYVVTTDFGNSMMQGSTAFNGMYGNYNFNNTGAAKSYLYIFNFDGTLAAKITIQ